MFGQSSGQDVFYDTAKIGLFWNVFLRTWPELWPSRPTDAVKITGTKSTSGVQKVTPMGLGTTQRSTSTVPHLGQSSGQGPFPL